MRISALAVHAPTNKSHRRAGRLISASTRARHANSSKAPSGCCIGREKKVPKLLLHRLFPNVRYSFWIDGKVKLVKDTYQLLVRGDIFFALSPRWRPSQLLGDVNRGCGL